VLAGGLTPRLTLAALRLPSSTAAYTIVVVEELRVQALRPCCRERGGAPLGGDDAAGTVDAVNADADARHVPAR
jgi:hypothetical protein